jgi:hypothetical protein
VGFFNEDVVLPTQARQILDGWLWVLACNKLLTDSKLFG